MKAKKADKLSKEKFIAIFREISQLMERNVMVCTQHLKQILEQTAGQKIPDEEIYSFLNKQLAERMQKSEASVYKKYETDEKAVKAAHKEYKDDENFKKIAARMKALASQFQPYTPTISEEECLEMVTEMADSLEHILKSSVKEITDSNPRLSKGTIPLAMLQPRIQKGQQEVITKLCGKYKMEPTEFDKCISAFKDSQAIAKQVEKIISLPAQYGIGGAPGV